MNGYSTKYSEPQIPVFHQDQCLNISYNKFSIQSGEIALRTSSDNFQRCF